MIDISLIRESPEIVRKNIKKKFQNEKLKVVDEILKLDAQWRKLKSEADNLRAERNKISKKIAETKKSKKDAEAKKLLKEARIIPQKIEEIEKKSSELQAKINSLLIQIPNILHESVPTGKDDTKNIVREIIGKPAKPKFEIKNHAELAESLGLADFETSSEISGTGFYILKGDLALLNQALLSYARDFMISKGYTYIETPLMLRSDIITKVADLNDMKNQIYKIKDEDLHLIGTSEHSLIGIHINKTLNHKELPIKLTSYSMCFRKEIGSHGIDEKGLFRTHQFNKQEMVIICRPEDSYKYYDELLNLSKQLLKKLKIPLRVFESCSGDLGDLKAKGADLEAWSPRQQKYFEATSVSNTTDAQARRLNIKFFDEKGQRRFVHILNNTAIATSRILVAILENYQQRDGTIKVPTILQKYMNGIKVLGKTKKK